MRDDGYRISMAVAGFTRDDLAVTQEQNMLMVAGKKSGEGEGERAVPAWRYCRPAGSSTVCRSTHPESTRRSSTPTIRPMETPGSAVPPLCWRWSNRCEIGRASCRERGVQYV